MARSSSIKRSRNNFIIRTEVFPCDVLVSIGTTQAELITYLRGKCQVELSGPEEAECFNFVPDTQGRAIFLKGKQVVIWLREPPKSPCATARMVHECFHAAIFILEYLGIKLSRETEEAYAYYLDYLVEQILDRLKQ